jgi:hypothetical protein
MRWSGSLDGFGFGVGLGLGLGFCFVVFWESAVFDIRIYSWRVQTGAYHPEPVKLINYQYQQCLKESERVYLPFALTISRMLPLADDRGLSFVAFQFE